MLGCDIRKMEIWKAARDARVIIVTKDSDFEERVRRLGPPQVLWLTCGNTSEARLKEIFEERLPAAIELFAQGEPLVEIQ
jgi:predicted nuclease of predicted toxin-antitoxin system